mmetsp:Transcript_119058/g.229651  ORF Transcript_119058/g.229651 Transcript_119058/m.229651 type:complete len:265 (-) Transcript_119058:65-859(-)
MASLRHWNQRQARCYEAKVTSFPTLSLCECCRFRFVAEQEVYHGQDLQNECFERGHHHEEGGREVQAVLGTRFCCLCCSQLHGISGHGDEEACAVDDLCLLHDLHVFRNVHMIDFEIVCCLQICAQRTLDAINQHGTGSGFYARVDHVASLHAILLTGGLHLVSEVIFANTSHVSSGTWCLKHPLGNADRVLSCTARNVLHAWPCRHLCKQWLVLVLCQDNATRFQPILVKHGFVHIIRDVKKRISHAQDGCHVLYLLGVLYLE